MSDVETDHFESCSKEKVALKEPKVRKTGELKPCERCRSQHLKCVYNSNLHNSKCQRCERTGNECVRSAKKIRFRDVPVSRFQTHRKSNRLSSASKIPTPALANETSKHIDTATEVGQGHDLEEAPISDQENLPITNGRLFDFVAENGFVIPSHNQITSEQCTTDIVNSRSIPQMMQNDHRLSLGLREISTVPDSEMDQLPQTVLPTPSEDRFSLEAAPPTRIFSPDRASHFSFGGTPQSRTRPASFSRYLDQMVKPLTRDKPQDARQYMETLLLRYFHEELAPWFDLCDPDCHFERVIPQRAREPGPLRSAIVTIAARNLSRNKRFRNGAGIVEWRGRQLPDLKEEFAMPYHNDCIRDLLHLSMDPKKLHDDTLLAAVLTLRTDEEMGFDMEDEQEDQQLFLRIANLFIDAQLPPALALPHSSPEVFQSTFEDEHSNMASPSIHTDDLGASGLRQACFWTAFRQDLHAAFLKQQPVRFPLTRCEAFRQLTPATDAVWTNRMVTFCADVLEFSYGSNSSDGKVTPAYTNQERWRELRDREKALCSLLPTTFEPTFCSEPNPPHTVFPEIWYLDSCHVSGTTYIELARMLLEVFNPTRPKIGAGFLAATNAFTTSTKKILFRLCGIALSNHNCPPSMINACLGISMFGEYFQDQVEQEALLGVLALMNHRFAYPTSRIANSLKQAWAEEDTEGHTSVTSNNHYHMDMG